MIGTTSSGTLIVRFGTYVLYVRLRLWATGGRSEGEALHGLAGDRGDEVEVLVHVEDGEAVQLRSSGDQKVWDRWRTVLSVVGEKGLDLDGAILDGGSEILDRQEREGWSGQVAAEIGGGSGGVADLEPGDGANSDETAVDSVDPLGRVGACWETAER